MLGKSANLPQSKLLTVGSSCHCASSFMFRAPMLARLSIGKPWKASCSFAKDSVCPCRQFQWSATLLSERTSNEDEIDAARKWLARLAPSQLPNSVGDVSYSRSSGPGGQNVNKYVAMVFTSIVI